MGRERTCYAMQRPPPPNLCVLLVREEHTRGPHFLIDYEQGTHTHTHPPTLRAGDLRPALDATDHFPITLGETPDQRAGAHGDSTHMTDDGGVRQRERKRGRNSPRKRIGQFRSFPRYMDRPIRSLECRLKRKTDRQTRRETGRETERSCERPTAQRWDASTNFEQSWWRWM